ncbi:glucosamine-6-phosphate deaminase [Staphylococcus sp. ACRSN]|uniref:glucosamine-6-phosphate deaminase n=1 Tax=Staphylococcus sp. ACRSN TaxID=2918214 RepID=UPI001EF2327A|nr:glucosamine-6-phosphate deaminase [Staphylococcus sp. ACRSN]MCG7339105.1 glucosamine-6-phosphate deaminase [Staphylococcus sp. ACRSN]
MKMINLKNAAMASQYVATELFKVIDSKSDAVLGLATGNTMLDVYRNLNTLIEANKLNLNRIRTFNLDEYIGLSKTHPQSYHIYMQEQLFKYNHTWNPNYIYIPNGLSSDVEKECNDYEHALNTLGPIDIQILGIGENGHIGFNEPGASFDSTTRIVELSESTIRANSIHFENEALVPKQAISMGIASIMKAQRIILLALGNSKSEIIERLLNGDVTEDLPASILHTHPNVEIIVDDAVYFGK